MQPVFQLLLEKNAWGKLIGGNDLQVSESLDNVGNRVKSRWF